MATANAKRDLAKEAYEVAKFTKELITLFESWIKCFIATTFMVVDLVSVAVVVARMYVHIQWDIASL